MLKYKHYLSFSDKTAWVDIGGIVNSKDTSFTEELCTTAFYSAQPSANITILYTGTSEYSSVVQRILRSQEEKQEVNLKITKPNYEVLFEGYIDLKKISIETKAIPSSIKLTAYDPIKKLENSVAINRTIYNKTTGEAIRELIALGGFDNASVVIPLELEERQLEVPIVFSDGNSRKIKDILDKLLQECGGYILRRNSATGSFIIEKIKYEDKQGENIETVHYRVSDSLKTENSNFTNDGVVVKIPIVKYKENQIVYIENHAKGSAYNSDGVSTIEGELIPQQSFYPENGDLKKTTQSYTVEYCDSVYNNYESRSKNEMSLYFVDPSSVHLMITCNEHDTHKKIKLEDTSINTYLTQPAVPLLYKPEGLQLYPTYFWFLGKNETNRDIDLIDMRVRGNVYYKDGEISVITPTLAKNPYVYTAEHISIDMTSDNGKREATDFSQLLVNIKENSNSITTFTAPWDNYSIGQKVFIEHKTLGRVKAIIVYKNSKLLGEERWAEYKAVSVNQWGFNIQSKITQSLVANSGTVSAYDVAVLNGFNGNEAEWLETLQGRGTFTCRLYRRSKTVPTNNIKDLIYNTETDSYSSSEGYTIAECLSGWNYAIEEGEDDLYFIESTKIIEGGKKEIVFRKEDFSAPVMLSGKTGKSACNITLYQRKALNPPSAPVSTATFNFSDNSLVFAEHEDWQRAMYGTKEDGDLYAVSTYVTSENDTVEININAWSDVVKINGSDGAINSFYVVTESNVFIYNKRRAGFSGVVNYTLIATGFDDCTIDYEVPIGYNIIIDSANSKFIIPYDCPLPQIRIGFKAMKDGNIKAQFVAYLKRSEVGSDNQCIGYIDGEIPTTINNELIIEGDTCVVYEGGAYIAKRLINGAWVTTNISSIQNVNLANATAKIIQEKGSTGNHYSNSDADYFKTIYALNLVANLIKTETIRVSNNGKIFGGNAFEDNSSGELRKDQYGNERWIEEEELKGFMLNANEVKLYNIFLESGGIRTKILNTQNRITEAKTISYISRNPTQTGYRIIDARNLITNLQKNIAVSTSSHNATIQTPTMANALSNCKFLKFAQDAKRSIGIDGVMLYPTRGQQVSTFLLWKTADMLAYEHVTIGGSRTACFRVWSNDSSYIHYNLSIVLYYTEEGSNVKHYCDADSSAPFIYFSGVIKPNTSFYVEITSNSVINNDTSRYPNSGWAYEYEYWLGGGSLPASQEVIYRDNFYRGEATEKYWDVYKNKPNAPADPANGFFVDSNYNILDIAFDFPCVSSNQYVSDRSFLLTIDDTTVSDSDCTTYYKWNGIQNASTGLVEYFAEKNLSSYIPIKIQYLDGDTAIINADTIGQIVGSNGYVSFARDNTLIFKNNSRTKTIIIEGTSWLANTVNLAFDTVTQAMSPSVFVGSLQAIEPNSVIGRKGTQNERFNIYANTIDAMNHITCDGTVTATNVTANVNVQGTANRVWGAVFN